ncbi:glycosyltransferase [Croceicoccus sp. F390]|uniref:Glycosyltransferase n=1 Tax=Croceicoccus esteveae TaxID=3075597 RepID=A0ABU2ZGL7_9SPHN|nr:glycosyltransferase [Croceicoccus sp. F390]MDT0575464.1 glycosyltransferase [Croceicoccus sp. F390]
MGNPLQASQLPRTRQQTEAHADILRLDIQSGQRPVASRRTLVIFEADNLPVGQRWVEAGEPVVIPDDVTARVLTRRKAPQVDAFAGSTSVVICTRDRPDELERCLASFSRQSRTPDELIVVDNASRGERTREVVLAAHATYVREDRPGLDYARNAGARAASGDIVLYTDDDTELHPHWVANTAAAFDKPEVMGVTGLVLPAALTTKAQWIFETEWGFGRGFDPIDFGREFFLATRKDGCPAWTIGAGANMAFRRRIFDEIGFFDERLDVGQAGCSGDSEFWYRVLAAGYVCRYEPTAVMYHHHRLEMAGLASQIYFYMRGHTAALMVQYQRTGEKGNLRRAFILLPRYYLGLGFDRLTRRVSKDQHFVGKQIAGAISGIWFFARNFRLPSP